jgi:hypothetical protein
MRKYQPFSKKGRYLVFARDQVFVDYENMNGKLFPVLGKNPTTKKWLQSNRGSHFARL